MEKKNYIQPNVKVIEIENQDLLQAVSDIETPIKSEGVDNNEDIDGF